MQKLTDLHLEAIEKSYHTVYRNMNEVEEVDNELAVSKSAEITKDVAIKFAIYISKYDYQGCNEDSSDNWGISTLTAQKLFEEFLKQYNGTIK